MTQEEKSLLLQDLCARLPYGVKVQDELGRINKLVIGNADLVRLYYNDFSIYREKALSLPLLRPLSSMTEDEAKEFDELSKQLFEHREPEKIWADVIDWLNAHHFDYRGLIEKGLAIEAPEGMYDI
jgi:hypothetical protein